MKSKDSDDEDGDKDSDQENNPEKTQLAVSTKKNKDKWPALNRPIILVCNDGYAKALYPLKDITLKLRVYAAS